MKLPSAKWLWLVPPFLFGLAYLDRVESGPVGDWRSASRASVGLAPNPKTTPEPVVQVYAARTVRWRGYFGVHTWVAVKPRNAAAFTVTSGTTNSNIAISLQAISPNPSTVGTATNSTVNFTNEASTFAGVTIETELANSGGAIVASQSQPVNLAPQQTIAVTLTWSPTAAGAYTVIGVVKDSSGAVLQQKSLQLFCALLGN